MPVNLPQSIDRDFWERGLLFWLIEQRITWIKLKEYYFSSIKIVDLSYTVFIKDKVFQIIKYLTIFCLVGDINRISFNWLLRCLVVRVSCSGIWPRVVGWVAPDVSEELIASIFRVEEIGSANRNVGWNSTDYTAHIPEYDTLQNYSRENLKSYVPYRVHKIPQQ
jgi:hypothetical protein